MRIDAHHHLWRLGDRRQDWLDEPPMVAIRRDFTVADLAVVAAAAGVDRTVLVQVLPDVGETVEFLAVAEGSDLVAGVVGWVDLTGADVAGALRRLRAGPGGDRLVGVRHLVQGEPDLEWLIRDDVLTGLRAVRDAGLVYDLLIAPHQLPAAVAAARAVPDLVFVLDHLAKPQGAGEQWSKWLRAFAAEPNTVAKVSGLVTDMDWRTWQVADLRPYVDTALEAFGPGRLMVGSDWPVCLLAADYSSVLGAAAEMLSGCSPSELEQVFGATAARVYRLAASDGT
ncbi:amidohydrolase family protein [Actinokineospora sp. 24-640]